MLVQSLVKHLTRTSLLFILTIIASSDITNAAEKSVQPYIDQIKEGLSTQTNQDTKSEPYIQSLKRKNSISSEPEKNYIETLKTHSPERFKADESSKGYTQREKDKLTPKPSGGAIAAFTEGRSDLKLRREGEIHHAGGVRVGTSLSRKISANSTNAVRPFKDVYGDKWTPDITLFYEFQPFHSEWLGNVGVVLSLGASYFSGNGSFEYAPAAPSGISFSTDSKTKFQFFMVPLYAGLIYRFNLLHILRPYVQAGPAVIGYYETRNDDKGSDLRGNSRAIFMGAGVAFLLDWIDRRFTWEVYAERGIKHSYLTIEYNRLTTFSGGIKFNVSGLNAGLTFEW